MPFPGNRAFPRHPVTMSATVEVRQTGGGVRIGGERTTRSRHQVALRDVSQGGLCFVKKDGEPFEKGTPVTVKIVVAARTLSLPGSVVWSTSAGESVATGVRVLTEITDSNTRSSFQRWLSSR